MKYARVISIIVALLLAFGTASGEPDRGKGAAAKQQQQKQQHQVVDRERMQNRTRVEEPDLDRVRDRDRQRIHDPAFVRDEEIYGHELMSEKELKQYRNELRKLKTAEKQEQYRVQHENRMRERAMEQGKDLEPPGLGPIYRSDLMSVQERNEYRERLRVLGSAEERTKFLAQHREKMQQRARAMESKAEEAE